ncbi:hypothetical protein G7Y89_g15072 [Cudoniella acicularis]|uniref:Uncharacterized protein n=1 Tax=Cudoniella acicularis TaxID=354080 RepID=A0A8H4QVG7_9HELO|nr:hypothetical protein G7Y89_g15072 [Cudoniella acicularis]
MRIAPRATIRMKTRLLRIRRSLGKLPKRKAHNLQPGQCIVCYWNANYKRKLYTGSLGFSLILSAVPAEETQAAPPFTLPDELLLKIFGTSDCLSHKPEFRKRFGTLEFQLAKQSIRDEIKLPAQRRYVVEIPFTPIEQQHYQDLFSQMCEECGLDIVQQDFAEVSVLLLAHITKRDPREASLVKIARHLTVDLHKTSQSHVAHQANPPRGNSAGSICDVGPTFEEIQLQELSFVHHNADARPPLMALQFFRAVMDEAQMIESGGTARHSSACSCAGITAVTSLVSLTASTVLSTTTKTTTIPACDPAANYNAAFFGESFPPNAISTFTQASTNSFGGCCALCYAPGFTCFTFQYWDSGVCELSSETAGPNTPIDYCPYGIYDYTGAAGGYSGAGSVHVELRFRGHRRGT